MPYRLLCVQHLSLNKQTGHLKNGKKAGKKEEAGKHYPKARVWGIVRAALAVALTEFGLEPAASHGASSPSG